jgi:hypothetical protein
MHVWEERRAWFEAQATEPDSGSYLLSEQACALSADLQSAFCSGSWIAVIILSAAIIDAHLHDAEGLIGNSKSVIDQAGADPRLQNLRKRRNRLIHVDVAVPAITVDQQWMDRAALEREARDAVSQVFGVFYNSPSV